MNDRKTVTTEPPEFLDYPERGGRYRYDRKATEDRGGAVALSQLADDEVVVWPGFIYRRTA